MTIHLPECRYVVFQQQGQIPEAVIPMGCICDALRACEARAREDERATVVAEFMSNHGDTATFDFGYAAGVRAARDAVASVPLVTAFTEDLALIRRPVALAAIDALRWES